MTRYISKKSFFVVTCILVLASYLFSICALTSKCLSHDVDIFLENALFTLLEPTFLFSLCLLPIAILLLFLKDEIFNLWLKFARWYLPLTILILILIPTRNGGFLPPLLTKESASWWLGGIFIVVSLIIIVPKLLSQKGR